MPDTFDDAIYGEGAETGLNVRVRCFNTFTTNLYYVAVLCNGELIFEADGEKIFNSAHENASLVSAVDAPQTASPVAVKAAATDFAGGGKLFEGLGGKLTAGNYTATVTFSNRSQKNEEAFNPNKVTEEQLNQALMDVTLTGAGDPIEVNYTKKDLQSIFIQQVL